MPMLRVPALNISTPLEVEGLQGLGEGELIGQVREALRQWFGRERIEVAPSAAWDERQGRWIGSLTYQGEQYQWIAL